MSKICNIDFSQSLNLYVHIPIITILLFLWMVVFLSNSKKPVNKSLSFFILILVFWVLNDLLQWMTFDESSILFFSRLSILGSLSVLFFLFFTYDFSNKYITVRKKIVFSLPFLPIVIFIFSNFNASINQNGNCDISLGLLYIYLVAIIMFFASWSVKNLFFIYKKDNQDEQVKNQIKIITIGFISAIIWVIIVLGLTNFSLFVNYSKGDVISLFIPVGMLFLVSFTVYAITKYQLLNTKVILAQAVVVTLWVLLGSQLLFVEVSINFILTLLALAIAIVLGIILIRSVKNEVKRKEELQYMSDRLAQSNDKLRALDNAKSEFISIASHQLRTPLTAIKGFISLLTEGTYGDIPKNQMDVLSKIYISNERLITLVEDLLNISRIESGRMEFRFEPCQLADLCKELLDTFSFRIKNAGLYIDFKTSGQPLPEVFVDSSKIREVLSNLIDNAIKYTTKGGITVRLERIFPGDSVLEKINEKGAARVIVSDTGMGVPAEEMPYLFSKFSRGKDTNRLSVGGTGLGLYVGRSMVEANGGKIWVESEGAGKGSRFIVELPVEQNAENLSRWN